MEPSDHERQRHLRIRFQIPADQLGFDSSDKRRLELEFSSAENFLAVYEILKKFGIKNTMNLISFAQGLSQVLAQAVAGGDIQNIQVAWDAIWRHLHQMTVVPQNIEDTAENRALWLTYRLLRDKEITHKQAADIASRLLGKEFKEDTWRIRVARWAKNLGLPPVQYRIGRPPKVEQK